MKPRKIVVEGLPYLWRTYRPNGDGDGGIGLRVWEGKEVIIELWLSGMNQPKTITPGFVAEQIGYYLRPVEFLRAGQECVCSCGKMYREHPYGGPFIVEPYGSRQWLHRLCDGILVKL